MAGEPEFGQLVSLLGSSDGAVRNGAALRLRDLQDNRAVEPLFQAIHVAANINNRGTLVYALQTLDCSEHFTDLFQLALHGNYEDQCMALIILEEQEFAADDAQLAKASEDLLAFLANPPAIENVELLAVELQAVLVRLEGQRGTGHAL